MSDLRQKIPDDCREEIKEMYADGLKIENIAWYIGVSTTAVANIVNPEKLKVFRQRYWRKLRADPAKMKIVSEKQKVHKNNWVKRQMADPVFKEKMLLRSRNQYQKNREKYLAYFKEYNKTHREELTEKSRKRYKLKRESKHRAVAQKLRDAGLAEAATKYLKSKGYES